MRQRLRTSLSALSILFVWLVSSAAAAAQDRLKSMPGYERYQSVGKKIASSFKSGALAVKWHDGGKAFEYRKDGKVWRYEVDTNELKTIERATPESRSSDARRGRGGAGGAPERGRQFSSAPSPDGALKAFCRDRNLWLSAADGSNEIAVTKEGDEKTRIKCGTASWVYGEELDQNTAMWWSPDGKRLGFYRFDESPIADYYLQLDQTKIQCRMDVEAYPKAGAPNPVADLLVYDLASKTTTKVDVRGGKPFDDDVVGHYVYTVSWTPDGTELLFHRTNRRQNVMELCAADPSTGKVRVILREEWPASWTENSPFMRFLADGKRFIWASERSGWRNFYLHDLRGGEGLPLTRHEFEVASVVRVDEAAGVLDYMARSGDNPLKLQLHRTGLDGKGDRRLTDPALHHSVDVAPDGRRFIDVAETHDVPPVTRLVGEDGVVIRELSKSDLSAYEALGLRRAELIRYPAADGSTELFGLLHFPSDFDPAKKYPLLVSVYAGPATNGARENFVLPSALTELGFLVATLDSRSAGGRGKRFLDSIYLKLGVTEIDDQAAGVKSLWNRPYLDRGRVGIFGVSYGGYASILCLLRHPDVFQAACASSPVTDWRHYDTIYTERYLWTPQGNAEGYDAGSAMSYADKLQGRLMLFYGTADNNVHPNNTMQLIKALQKAGKSFEVQIGPDQGHSGISSDRMMEFFIERLPARSTD
jgi:dipeptidyl-peptidase 4